MSTQSPSFYFSPPMFILEQKRKKDLIPEASIVLSIHIPFCLNFSPLCSWLLRTLSLAIPGPQINVWGFRSRTKISLCVFLILEKSRKLAFHNGQRDACWEVGAQVSLCSPRPRGGELMTHSAQNTSLEKAWRMGPRELQGSGKDLFA